MTDQAPAHEQAAAVAVPTQQTTPETSAPAVQAAVQALVQALAPALAQQPTKAPAQAPAAPETPQAPITPETVPAWSTAHLSPLAAFQPQRVAICTYVQMAAVDNTISAGHLEAALKHMRAATDQITSDDRWYGDRLVGTLRMIQESVNRLMYELR